MARTLTGPSAVEVIEEAIHLLRGNLSRSLALAWTGAVPFAIGTLLFWRDMTHHRGGDVLCAVEALALLVLLLWMNVWRGIFAVTLQALLAGEEPADIHPPPAITIGAQLLMGNLKLLLLPFAGLAVLPFPGAVAFFRIAVGIAAVERTSFFDTVAKARKLTRTIAQPALLLLLLGFVGLLLFTNILAALAFAPKLILALTGHESSFTRLGIRILADPSFYLVAGLIAWLGIEPLTQTVYVVAAFHAESNETGEDVRVRFRSLLRMAGSTAALFAVLAISVPAFGARVDPAALDHSIQQTFAAPEYSWHLPHPAAQGGDSWFVRFTDSIGRGLSGVFKMIGRAVEWFFQWLRELFAPTPLGRHGPPASGEIRTGLYLASFIVLIGAVYLFWRARFAFKRKGVVVAMAPKAVNLAAEDLTADQLPEEHWYQLADECFRKGEFRLGLRALHLATLAWLGREHWIAIHSGKTDHEYENELKRRARAFPQALLQFSSNIGAFEQSWYGDHAVSSEICRAFRDRTEEMKREMVQPGVAR